MSTLSIHSPVSKGSDFQHPATEAALALLLEECRQLPEVVKECRKRAHGFEHGTIAFLYTSLPDLAKACLPAASDSFTAAAYDELFGNVSWLTAAEQIAAAWSDEAIVRYEAELREDIENQIATMEREAAEQEAERFDGMD